MAGRFRQIPSVQVPLAHCSSLAHGAPSGRREMHFAGA